MSTTPALPVGSIAYLYGNPAAPCTIVQADEHGAIVREHDDRSEGWHPWTRLHAAPWRIAIECASGAVVVEWRGGNEMCPLIDAAAVDRLARHLDGDGDARIVRAGGRVTVVHASYPDEPQTIDAGDLDGVPVWAWDAGWTWMLDDRAPGYYPHDEPAPASTGNRVQFVVEFDADAWATCDEDERAAWIDRATAALAEEAHVVTVATAD